MRTELSTIMRNSALLAAFAEKHLRPDEDLACCIHCDDGGLPVIVFLERLTKVMARFGQGMLFSNHRDGSDWCHTVDGVQLVVRNIDINEYANAANLSFFGLLGAGALKDHSKV